MSPPDREPAESPAAGSADPRRAVRDAAGEGQGECGGVPGGDDAGPVRPVDAAEPRWHTEAMGGGAGRSGRGPDAGGRASSRVSGGTARGQPPDAPGGLAVTTLLRAASSGDAGAEEALFVAVRAELRRIAAGRMAGQPRAHTLQATALVHDAFLRVARSDVTWVDRDHFFSTAARAMRQILVDHARTRRRGKRTPDGVRVPLDSVLVAFEERAHDVLALDEALDALAQFDARAARIVELRFFGGLSPAEIARQLGVSARTVERDWESARAWLAERLSL